MKQRILHISEAFAGGVETSLHAICRNNPQSEHHLLVSYREFGVSKVSASDFASVSPMRKNPLLAIIDIHKRYKSLKPDYIHLHSSYAGVYGRLTLIPSRKLIYSPHGFAFLRESDPKLARLLFLTVEAMLSYRLGGFAGVNLHELGLAQRFNRRLRSTFLRTRRTCRHPQCVVPSGMELSTWSRWGGFPLRKTRVF